MATSAQLKSSIKQIETAMKNKALKATSLAKFQTQLDRLKGELASLNSPKPKKGVTKAKVLTKLQKLKLIIKADKELKGYKNSGIDIEKDADEPAMKRGVRFSKGLRANQFSGKGNASANKGRRYYEYRLNRADVKQPPKKYPKLEYGGYMAKGGVIEHGLKVGDKITSSFDNIVVVENGSKTFVVNLNVGKRWSEKQWMLLNHGDTSKNSKMSDGGMMAKGGITSTKAKQIFAEYEENEDNNAHSENVVLLAKHFGTEQDLRDAKIILSKHEAIGNLPSYLQEERSSLHNKLYPKLVAAKNKMSGGGYMAKGGEVEAKYKVGDMVYSYQNKNEAAQISYVKFVAYDSQSGKSDKDKYIYKLKLADGYSNWINEESLSKSKMSDGGYMEHGGSLGSVKSSMHRYDK